MGLGEEKKIARGIDHAIKTNFLCNDFKIWGAYDGSSLFMMQLAKTSVKLAQLADAKLPYISLCTDPTTEELPLLMLC
jgi:acetyl-CoA carboxylase carboxyl transferase subunit beta